MGVSWRDTVLLVWLGFRRVPPLWTARTGSSQSPPSPPSSLISLSSGGQQALGGVSSRGCTPRARPPAHTFCKQGAVGHSLTHGPPGLAYLDQSHFGYPRSQGHHWVLRDRFAWPCLALVFVNRRKRAGGSANTYAHTHRRPGRPTRRLTTVDPVAPFAVWLPPTERVHGMLIATALRWQ